MHLIARVAKHNIGYIDWEPYIPRIFTRIIRSFDLPVTYAGHQNGTCSKLDVAAISMWIVSALDNNGTVIEHFQHFMGTIESYYHHANFGRWGGKLKVLLKKLPADLIDRLHREQYAKPSWNNTIPPEAKLNDQTITLFVEALIPSVTHSIYGSMHEVTTALQNLSLIRPQIIVPIILDKLYSTLGTLEQPHKLTSGMVALISVARATVKETPLDVISLLMSLLPGIDPNDIRKSLVTFQFISSFVSLIPLVDCSKAAGFYTDLNDEEHAVCEATAQFEDFVLQFMDRIFCIIDCSALEFTRLEHTDNNTDKKSKLETLAESALMMVCGNLLMQTSPNIFKVRCDFFN